MATTHFITDKQTLLDISLLHYGNVDGVFEIISANENIDFNNDLIKERSIIIPELKGDEQMLAYFSDNNTKIATQGNSFANPNAGFSFGFSLGFNS